jgi:hypothetical protein
MLVNGCDCSITVKTQFRETGIPYSEETIREAVSLLTEEAAIEGDGSRKAIRKSGQQVGLGVTGCVVTPLTIGTAPLLLYLAMGHADVPEYVSETRNLYRYMVHLVAVEDSTRFDLIQERGTRNGGQLAMNRKLYENCRVQSFELRVLRGEAIKLKVDITSERPPAIYPYTDPLFTEGGERFMGDRVTYRINGVEYATIYGLTVTVTKDGGTQTAVVLKRVIEPGMDLPEAIDELVVTAKLYRDRYEHRHVGMFRLVFLHLLLQADGAMVDTGGAVIGPLRYYCAGLVQAEVFTADGGTLE